MGADDNIHVGAGLTPAHVAMFKSLAEETAEKTTRRWFLLMGLPPDDPLAAQESFVALRKLQAKANDPVFLDDLSWMQRMHGYAKGAVGKAIVTAVGIAVTGSMVTFYQGARVILGLPPSHP